uniref:Uncharacterized protein n=1 Tax=Sphaerodactylus townsendi TaxID=933632 RepID=A0ACB8ETK3_9SAUR
MPGHTTTTNGEDWNNRKAAKAPSLLWIGTRQYYIEHGRQDYCLGNEGFTVHFSSFIKHSNKPMKSNKQVDAFIHLPFRMLSFQVYSWCKSKAAPTNTTAEYQSTTPMCSQTSQLSL